MGVHSIAKIMINLSELAGLSQRYTNHCVGRATVITTLSDEYSDEDIVRLTGHASATSLQPYRNVARAQKQIPLMQNTVYNTLFDASEINTSVLPDSNAALEIPTDIIQLVQEGNSRATEIV